MTRIAMSKDFQPYDGPVLERFEFEGPERVGRYNDFARRWMNRDDVAVLVPKKGTHLLVVPRAAYDAWRARYAGSRD